MQINWTWIWDQRSRIQDLHDTWLRTMEEDLRQFNLGLTSGLRRAQNRTTWRTLTGTTTSPTSSDWQMMMMMMMISPKNLITSLWPRVYPAMWLKFVNKFLRSPSVQTIRIQISPKIQSTGPCPKAYHSTKFNEYSSTTFWDITCMDRQTRRRTDRHTNADDCNTPPDLVGWGNKRDKIIISVVYWHITVTPWDSVVGIVESSAVLLAARRFKHKHCFKAILFCPLDFNRTAFTDSVRLCVMF